MKRNNYYRKETLIVTGFHLTYLYVNCLKVCCCSVAKSQLTLHNPMDYSTPGFPVPHHLPEFAQVHVHALKYNSVEHRSIHKYLPVDVMAWPGTCQLNINHIKCGNTCMQNTHTWIGCHILLCCRGITAKFHSYLMCLG